MAPFAGLAPECGIGFCGAILKGVNDELFENNGCCQRLSRVRIQND
jgi:hypothetical protein